MSLQRLRDLRSRFRRTAHEKQARSTPAIGAISKSTETNIIPKQPIEPIYNHPITTNSPQILLQLPTEILDGILFHLNKEELATVRASHRLFSASIRSLVFRAVDLFEFRKSERISKAEQFLLLLQNDAQLRSYVRSVKLRSILDPTVREEIERLLPEILRLLELKELTVTFREQFVTKNTQMDCTATLYEIFKNIYIPELRIECNFPSTIIMEGLSELNVSAVVVTGTHISPDLERRTIERSWFTMLNNPTLRRVDLGSIPIRPEQLETLCTTIPNLTELGFTITRNTSHTALLEALCTKTTTLRELNIRRLPVCRKGVIDGSRLCLNTLTALRKLTMDASFLFGPILCITGLPTPLIHHSSYDPSVLTRTINNLPPHLHSLTVTFTFAQPVFQRGYDAKDPVHDFEFEWMLEVARNRATLRHLVLVEELHECEGEMHGGLQLPQVGEGRKVEFVVPRGVERQFCERGVGLRIWIQEEVGEGEGEPYFLGDGRR